MSDVIICGALDSRPDITATEADMDTPHTIYSFYNKTRTLRRQMGQQSSNSSIRHRFHQNQLRDENCGYLEDSGKLFGYETPSAREHCESFVVSFQI